MMNKCGFCTQSAPDGECCHTVQAPREQHCKKAIELMVKALGKKKEQSEDNVY